MSYDTTVGEAIDPPLARVDTPATATETHNPWRLWRARLLIAFVILTAIAATGILVGVSIGAARAKHRPTPGLTAR